MAPPTPPPLGSIAWGGTPPPRTQLGPHRVYRRGRAGAMDSTLKTRGDVRCEVTKKRNGSLFVLILVQGSSRGNSLGLVPRPC